MYKNDRHLLHVNGRGTGGQSLKSNKNPTVNLSFSTSSHYLYQTCNAFMYKHININYSHLLSVPNSSEKVLKEKKFLIFWAEY